MAIDIINNQDGAKNIRENKLNPTILAANEVPNKIDKVPSAVEGNTAIWGSGGVLLDSGFKPGGGEGVNIPQWDILIEYSIDYVVRFDSRLFVSKADNNIGNQPPIGGGENTYWREVSENKASSTPLWQAGIYDQERAEVYRIETGILKKYVLKSTSLPYESSDLDAEVLAGDWQYRGCVHSSQFKIIIDGSGQEVVYFDPAYIAAGYPPSVAGLSGTRVQPLILEGIGVLPTIPSGDIYPGDPLWLATDIMEGEQAYNKTDNLTYTRSGSEIITLNETPEPVGNIIYVDINASGNDDGTSWADAFNSIHDAITASKALDEIWIAAGTYYPTITTDRTISFQPKSNTSIYGGFASGETSKEQRDFDTNETILSGDIGTSGVDTDNSQRLLTMDGVSNITINGISITKAYHTSGEYDSLGGGIGINNCNNIVTDKVKVYDCYATNYYAGLKVGTSQVDIINCLFDNNEAAAYYGVGRFTQSSIIMKGCTISNNIAGTGVSGFAVDQCNILVDNCNINNNTDNGLVDAGYATFYIFTRTVPTYNVFINNLFKDNHASFGCILMGNNSLAELYACNNVFDGNSCTNPVHANGIDFSGDSIGYSVNNTYINGITGVAFNIEGASDGTVYNYNDLCYNNEGGSLRGESGSTATWTVSNCRLDTAIIDFVGATETNTQIGQTLFDNDYRPLTTSCYNRGDNVLYQELIDKIKFMVGEVTKDYLGNNRISEGIIDIGAVEYQNSNAVISDNNFKNQLSGTFLTSKPSSYYILDVEDHPSSFPLDSFADSLPLHFEYELRISTDDYNSMAASDYNFLSFPQLKDTNQLYFRPYLYPYEDKIGIELYANSGGGIGGGFYHNIEQVITPSDITDKFVKIIFKLEKTGGTKELKATFIFNGIINELVFTYINQYEIFGGLDLYILNSSFSTSDLTTDVRLDIRNLIYYSQNEYKVVAPNLAIAENRGVAPKPTIIDVYQGSIGEKLQNIIESGWVNRSDWTNVHIGLVEITQDVITTAFNIGELVTGGTSNATGIVHYINGSVLVLKNVGGSGIFSDTETITGDRGGQATLTFTGSSNKDVDSNVYHGLGQYPRYLNYNLYLSTDGTEANSFLAQKGLTLHTISDNEIKLQSDANGLAYINDSGVETAINTQDWYYNILIELI